MVETKPAPDDKSIADVISGLWELTVDYAKQETVDPLKGLGRYLGFGVAGALGVGLGLVMISLAVLRFLQTETGTALTGNWSWVPYLAVIVVSALAIAVLAKKIQQPTDASSSKPGDRR